MNRKHNDDKCTYKRHGATDTCQISGPFVGDKEQLLVTELLTVTDWQITLNVEIPGEVLTNEDDIDTLYNSMKNQETVIPQPERKSLWKYIKSLNTAYGMRNSSVCTACDVL